MTYNEKIQKIVAPYYAQFEKLGELYDDDFLSWAFLKKARKTFGKQYFFELKLLFKAENRTLKHQFSLVKAKDKERFKKDKKLLRQKLKQRRQDERRKWNAEQDGEEKLAAKTA